MTADPNDLGAQPEDDDTTEADRTAKLADQLAGIYDLIRLTELEQDDPQRAQDIDQWSLRDEPKNGLTVKCHSGAWLFMRAL